MILFTEDKKKNHHIWTKTDMERIDESNPSAPTSSNNKRLIIGTIVIFIGFLFIGKQFNMLPREVYDVIFSWQMLLILIGIIGLLFHQNKLFGSVLILVGGFFIFTDISSVDPTLRKLFWPLLLILIGLFIIFRKPLTNWSRTKASASGLPGEFIDDIAFFGGGQYNFHSEHFKGGKVTAIFGGSEFDLADCKQADGQNVIDIFTLFGGTTFYVPDDWNVKVDVMNLFGGFSDSRKKTTSQKDSSKTLIIKGLVLFGGGDIKSA